MTTSEQIATAIMTLAQNVHDAADAIARENSMANATAQKVLLEGLSAHFGVLSNFESDRRAAKWLCRFRLYDMRFPDEPRADTDPERTADQPGTQIITGLPNVAIELGALAAAFHASPLLKGLHQAELERRLLGLRPTLSRRGGNAVWRVPYDTAESWSETKDHKAGWLARVDIERVTQ